METFTYEYLYYINILINVLVFVYYILYKCIKKKKIIKCDRCLLTKDDLPQEIENNIRELISHNINDIDLELPKVTVLNSVNIELKNEL